MTDPDLCIHCKSYWRVGHAASCPQTTNLWPVTEAEAEMVCMGCHGDLGDHYTVVDGCIVCLGCAAHAAIYAAYPDHPDYKQEWAPPPVLG